MGRLLLRLVKTFMEGLLVVRHADTWWIGIFDGVVVSLHVLHLI